MTVKIVAKWILIRNNKLLIEKRLRNETNYAGIWSFPMGHKKPGEPITRTLKREALEELRIKIKKFKKIHTFLDTDPTSKKKYRIHVFLCPYNKDIKKTYEQEKISWVTIKQAKRKLKRVDKKILKLIV